MNKEISSKTTVVVFGVLIILSLVAFYVFADWNEPSQTPPAGNVPAPINVGDEAQQKTGTLTVPIVYDRDDPSYYVNPSGTTIFAGPIGIGPTSSPVYTLDVAGDMGVSEDISVVGYINTNNIYKQNNISGVNKTCGVGELLKGIHVSGGIVTAGKCSTDQTGGAGGGIGGSGVGTQVAFFVSGSPSTTIASDTNLYWDDINKRLGIKTASPAYPLDVSGVIGSGGLFADGLVKMTSFKMSTNASSGYVLTSNEHGEGTWQPPSTSGGIGGSVMYLKSVNIPEFCPTASGWSQADYRVMGDDGCGNDIRQRVCYRTDRACQVMYLQGFSVGTTPTTGPPPECPSSWLEADYSNIVEYSNFTSLKRRTCYKCE